MGLNSGISMTSRHLE